MNDYQHDRPMISARNGLAQNDLAANAEMRTQTASFSGERRGYPCAGHDSGGRVRTRKLLTIAETAEVLRISKPTCYTLARRADFPSIKIGNRILVDADGLIRWIDASIERKAEISL